MQQRVLLQQEAIFSEQEPCHRVLRPPRPHPVPQSRVQTPAAAGRALAGGGEHSHLAELARSSRLQGDCCRSDVNSAFVYYFERRFYNCKDKQFIQTSSALHVPERPESCLVDSNRYD